MSTTPAQTAETAVAAHFAADPTVNAQAVAGQPNKLRSGLLVVECADAAWQPYRWICEMAVTGYAGYKRPAAGQQSYRQMMDSAIVSVTKMRTASGVHWLGPATDLTYAEADTVESDGARYATGELSFTVAVDRPDSPRAVGSSEQAVRDVIAAGGHNAVDGSDRPPFVVTRWGGSSAGDPHSDDVIVQAATEIESGQYHRRRHGRIPKSDLGNMVGRRRFHNAHSGIIHVRNRNSRRIRPRICCRNNHIRHSRSRLVV